MRARVVVACLAWTSGAAAASSPRLVDRGKLHWNDPVTQHRALAFAPPTGVHLVDAEGRWQRPFIYAEDGSRHPVRFFVRGSHYRLFGLMDTDVHVFGTDSTT